MDPGCSLFSVICLLGAALCSNGDNISCPCPNIPSFDLTEPPLETCFQINDPFRYKCIGGYKRRVGTSNLIKCKQTEGGSPEWSTPSLQCIADPNRPTTQPPKSTVTQRHTATPHGSTITTSVTASSQPQMTQSISTAASVTTGRDRAKTTSHGLQAQTDHSQAGNVTETKGTQWTTSTSTTAEPSSTRIVSPGLPTNLSTTAPRHGSETTAAIGCSSLALVLALIGISLYCYKRKSRNSIPPDLTEEQLYMNAVPSDLAS